MAEPQIYHLAALDIRTVVADQLVKLGAVRGLAMAAINIADQATAQLEDVLARVDVELN